MLFRLAGIALALLVGLFPFAALAQTPAPVEALRQFLADPAKPETLFAPSFLADVPADQAQSLARSLTAQFGEPLAVDAVTKRRNGVYAFDIVYARAMVSMVLSVADSADRPVIGWMVTGSHFKDDSPDKIVADVIALPGDAAILLARIDSPAEPLIAYRANDTLAIGSTFKLWVLAEVAAQVRAGMRRWTDIVPLGSPSLPSGITQDWPAQSPMTLHSLATLMISISDNSATDTLIAALGRAAVRRQADGGNAGFPVLLTREAFALKMPTQKDLLDRFRAARTDQKATLLQSHAHQLTLDRIDPARLTQPRAIDTAEWFASPLDIRRTFGRLRGLNSPEAMAILATNPGIPPDEAQRFSWIGYKGGSESGVISLSWLVQTKQDHWYVLSASWNNSDALVDKDHFGVIARRALAQLANK